MKYNFDEYNESLERILFGVEKRFKWLATFEADKIKMMELVKRQKPIKPVLIGSHTGVEFKDGRKSPDLYVGTCECGQVVYSNWQCCPYCTKLLEWSQNG